QAPAVAGGRYTPSLRVPSHSDVGSSGLTAMAVRWMAVTRISPSPSFVCTHDPPPSSERKTPPPQASPTYSCCVFFGFTAIGIRQALGLVIDESWKEAPLSW